jgi:hypothetical protein
VYSVEFFELLAQAIVIVIIKWCSDNDSTHIPDILSICTEQWIPYMAGP